MFMHALLALQELKVELINSMFSTVFRDFCRVIDEEWDILVDCIDAGSIPDLESVGDLKDKLQVSGILSALREVVVHLLDAFAENFASES